MDPRIFHQQSGRIGTIRGAGEGRVGRRHREFVWD